jgi:hypothetical protein
VHGGVFLKICDVNEQVIGAGNVLRPLKRLIGVLMAMLSVTNVCVSSRRENSFLNSFFSEHMQHRKRYDCKYVKSLETLCFGITISLI